MTGNDRDRLASDIHALYLETMKAAGFQVDPVVDRPFDHIPDGHLMKTVAYAVVEWHLAEVERHRPPLAPAGRAIPSPTAPARPPKRSPVRRKPSRPVRRAPKRAHR